MDHYLLMLLQRLQQQQQRQQHLPAAEGTPDAGAIHAATTPAIDPSYEESEDNASTVTFWLVLPMLQQQQSSSPVRHRHTRR